MNQHPCAIFRYGGVLLLLAGFLMGCSSTAPTVTLEDAPEEIKVNQVGVFEFSFNSDASEPLDLQWDFGDGTVYSGLLTTHQFTDPGTYEVRFSARNDAGYDEGTVEVAVQPPPEPVRIATLTAIPNPGVEGDAISFDTQAQGTEPFDYAWDLGDGTAATESEPTHHYGEPGTYTVSVRIQNNAGADTRTLTVTVDPRLPEICHSVREMNTAFFESNSSTLTREARSGLQENVELLATCSNLTVRAEGFAATNERNPASLSADRAEAVIDFYQNEGVDRARITAHHRGVLSDVEAAQKGDQAQQRRVDSIPVRE